MINRRPPDMIQANRIMFDELLLCYKYICNMNAFFSFDLLWFIYQNVSNS
jgi:hypothetical protein